MIICDLCRNDLRKRKYVVYEKRKLHVCQECLEICKLILKDPGEATTKITYLNEYRERKKI